MTFRDDTGGMAALPAPHGAVPGQSDAPGALTHRHPGLRPRRQSPAIVTPRTAIHPAESSPSGVGCSRDRARITARPSRGHAMLPGCSRSAAARCGVLRTGRPGQASLTQLRTLPTGGIPPGCVRAGKVVYILRLAWKRPRLTWRRWARGRGSG